jgi:putative aldouronate transport system substrate-binding protein
MKRFVKWVAILCAVVMGLSLVACGKNDSPTGSEQSKSDTSTTQSEGTSTAEIKEDGPLTKYDPPIEFSTVMSLTDAMQNYIGVKEDVLTNNNWINGYEKDLGIKVNYKWSVPSTQYDQKLNAQIASDDLPDIMQVSATQLKSLVDAGMVYDMTQVFNDYQSPFTREMMAADGGVALSQATFNDKLMALPNVGGNKDSASMLWIRQDWLDKLGLKAPTTTDELVALAKAFTENDPDGNGKADTFGIAMNNAIYTGGNSDMTGFFEGLGVNPTAWIEGKDGKAEFGLIQPQIKQGLSILAGMYKDGYMDKEFLTKDGSKVAEDIVAGKVGMLYGQHWLAFWPLQDSINQNKNADWIPYPIPSIDGQPAKVTIGSSAGTFYAVNVNCKHPEAAVKLLNYFYEKDCALSEGADTQNFHITSNQATEHPEAAFDWAVVKSFYPLQNLFIHDGVVKYLDGDDSVLENSWVKDNAIQCEKYEEDPVENAVYWSSYRWSGPKSAFTIIDYYDTNKLMLQNLYIMSDTDSMVQYNTTLDQLALETFTKIIMGTASIDEFDNFVSQWKNLGGDKITEEVNTAIGR